MLTIHFLTFSLLSFIIFSKILKPNQKPPNTEPKKAHAKMAVQDQEKTDTLSKRPDKKISSPNRKKMDRYQKDWTIS